MNRAVKLTFSASLDPWLEVPHLNGYFLASFLIIWHKIYSTFQHLQRKKSTAEEFKVLK